MTDYIIPPKNLDDLAKKFGIGKYARKPEGKVKKELELKTKSGSPPSNRK